MSDDDAVVRFGSLTLSLDRKDRNLVIRTMARPTDQVRLVPLEDVEEICARIESDEPGSRKWEIGIAKSDAEWIRLFFFREEQPYGVPNMVEAWARELGIGHRIDESRPDPFNR